MPTTKESIRCRHCAYLVEDEDGDWYCEDQEQKCELIEFCEAVETEVGEEE